MRSMSDGLDGSTMRWSKVEQIFPDLPLPDLLSMSLSSPNSCGTHAAAGSCVSVEAEGESHKNPPSEFLEAYEGARF
jgi:hypothetical protein